MALDENPTLARAFGMRVRQVRQSKGMTMQALADKMNVEFCQIARIEAGEVNTILQMAFAIAGVFGVGLRELFDFEVEWWNSNHRIQWLIVRFLGQLGGENGISRAQMGVRSLLPSQDSETVIRFAFKFPVTWLR